VNYENPLPLRKEKETLLEEERREEK